MCSFSCPGTVYSTSDARRAARELSRSDRYSDDNRSHTVGERLASNVGYAHSAAEWEEERAETIEQLQVRSPYIYLHICIYIHT